MEPEKPIRHFKLQVEQYLRRAVVLHNEDEALQDVDDSRLPWYIASFAYAYTQKDTDQLSTSKPGGTRIPAKVAKEWANILPKGKFKDWTDGDWQTACTRINTRKRNNNIGEMEEEEKKQAERQKKKEKKEKKERKKKDKKEKKKEDKEKRNEIQLQQHAEEQQKEIEEEERKKKEQAPIEFGGQFIDAVGVDYGQDLGEYIPDNMVQTPLRDKHRPQDKVVIHDEQIKILEDFFAEELKMQSKGYTEDIQRVREEIATQIKHLEERIHDTLAVPQAVTQAPRTKKRNTIQEESEGEEAQQPPVVAKAKPKKKPTKKRTHVPDETSNEFKSPEEQSKTRTNIEMDGAPSPLVPLNENGDQFEIKMKKLDYEKVLKIWKWMIAICESHMDIEHNEHLLIANMIQREKYKELDVKRTVMLLKGSISLVHSVTAVSEIIQAGGYPDFMQEIYTRLQRQLQKYNEKNARERSQRSGKRQPPRKKSKRIRVEETEDVGYQSSDKEKEKQATEENEEEEGENKDDDFSDQVLDDEVIPK